MIEERIDDPRMYDHIIAVVEKAIADAVPPRPFRAPIAGGIERVTCPWETKTGAPAVAERSEYPDGFTYDLQVRNPDAPTDPYTMTQLQVSRRSPGEVYWFPGLNEVPKEQFLAWWEATVGLEAWTRYKATYGPVGHSMSNE